MKNLIIIFILSLIIASCGEDKNQTAGKDSVSTSKDPVNVQPPDKTDADTTKGSTTDLNMMPGLPADYPKDIPQPKNASSKGSFKSSEGTEVVFSASGNVKDMAMYFEDEMEKSGFKQDGQPQQDDKSAVIKWTKDSRTVGLMIAATSADSLQIVVTYK